MSSKRGARSQHPYQSSLHGTVGYVGATADALADPPVVLPGRQVQVPNAAVTPLTAGSDEVAGPGGAAEAVTVEVPPDAPVAVTNIVIPQAVVVGDEATLPSKDFYAKDTDPGAVGAGSVWRDTSAAPYLQWERNAANDGWDANGSVRVVSPDALPASAGAAAEAGDGGADAGGSAVASGTGWATASAVANAAGDGSAIAGNTATTAGAGDAGAPTAASANGTGDADVRATAYAAAGIAQAGSEATNEDFGTAGMRAIVDGTSARTGFFGKTPVARPELPASPTEQDIADVLVALGLVTQAP